MPCLNKKCCVQQVLLGTRGGGRARLFEVCEGVGCGSGALDGPVALAAALVAAGGPAAPAGQAVIRFNVASMVVRAHAKGTPSNRGCTVL